MCVFASLCNEYRRYWRPAATSRPLPLLLILIALLTPARIILRSTRPLRGSQRLAPPVGIVTAAMCLQRRRARLRLPSRTGLSRIAPVFLALRPERPRLPPTFPRNPLSPHPHPRQCRSRSPISSRSRARLHTRITLRARRGGRGRRRGRRRGVEYERNKLAPPHPHPHPHPHPRRAHACRRACKASSSRRRTCNCMRACRTATRRARARSRARARARATRAHHHHRSGPRSCSSGATR